MSIIRQFRSDVTVTDALILVDTLMDESRIKSTITRGGSETSDLQTLMGNHKSTLLSTVITATSPSITLDTYRRWRTMSDLAVVGGAAVTIKVPSGNSGVLKFRLDVNPVTGTPQYKKNSGAWTTITNGATLSVADGDTLALRSSGMVNRGTISGAVLDNSTNKEIDVFKFESTATSSSIQPCTASPVNGWNVVKDSGTIESVAQTITVPSGNSGSLKFKLDSTGATGTPKYSKNGGTYTTFTDGTSVTFANTDTLKFEGISMVSGDVLSGQVIDNDTGALVDGFSIERGFREPGGLF